LFSAAAAAGDEWTGVSCGTLTGAFTFVHDASAAADIKADSDRLIIFMGIVPACRFFKNERFAIII
jgi:hypothetical protein